MVFQGANKFLNLPIRVEYSGSNLFNILTELRDDDIVMQNVQFEFRQDLRQSDCLLSATVATACKM